MSIEILVSLIKKPYHITPMSIEIQVSLIKKPCHLASMSEKYTIF